MRFDKNGSHLLGHPSKRGKCYFYSFAIHYSQKNKSKMRKIILTSLLFALTQIFCQCKQNLKKENSVSAKQDSIQIQYDSIISMNSLKEMGIDKDALLKHIKLQKLAWYCGDFRDDQSKPRYEPTKEDFLLTIPFVEYYLSSHGYKRPTEKLFQDRINIVFKIKLNMHNNKDYQHVTMDDEYYDFAGPFYAIKSKRFITYNWLLRDMLSIEGDKIKLKSEVFKQILALNKFLIYKDPNAFKVLDLSKYEGNEDDLGTFYNGKNILEDLVSSYNYFESPLLNQWIYDREKDTRYGFVSRIFDKSPNNKLIVNLPLITTLEKNATAKNGTIYNYWGLYVFHTLKDDNDVNSDHYSLEEKAKMFCYYANSEYKMLNKYGNHLDTNGWGGTSWTYVIMTNCEPVYEEAKKHNFFGISKPAMMEEMEQEGLELNPPRDDEE